MKKPTKFQAYWLAARPKTLWAAVSPVIIGSALAFADGGFHPVAALVAALGAVLIQIGTNYANDYYDFLKGADDEERLGPTRATQAGWVTPQEMRRATLLVFSLTFVIGLYLVSRAGWPILLVGVLSILFGILYTAGPYPLGYHGLGDIFVFIFFGLVAVGGSYYVQTLRLTPEVLLAGIAPGLFSTAILTVNNLRDLPNDRRAGKRTLAVRFGEKFARMEYFFSVGIALLMPLLMIGLTGGHYAALLAMLAIFPSLPSLRIIGKEPPGRIMNEVLANTGKSLFIYSLLFSIGWIL
ncbi:MAG: 1,4-dihydroxy-2-naphthoate polyprenyltransferase [Calditrichia bacterium]